MHGTIGAAIIVALCGGLAAYVTTTDRVSPHERPAIPDLTGGETTKATAVVPTLAFSELIDGTGQRLTLSSRAKSLAGQRVRMTGYMAALEEPPKGAFYLTAIPVRGDESGGGTGDLPLASVLVLSRSVESIDVITAPVEVTGTLSVGRSDDSEGRPTWLRLQLD